MTKDENDMSDNDLAIWTVYDNPTDRPGLFVARRFLVSAKGVRATETVCSSKTLDALRAVLAAQNLTRLDRNEDDDPVIVETWV
jgi:hypothetical protein